MKKNDSLLAPDILFCVAREAISGHGEDSWYYTTDYKNTVIGVFDGSGGIGSQQYPSYQNHTGAYIASRAVSGSVQAWFNSAGKLPLESAVKGALAKCINYSGSGSSIKLKGSLRKDFPTTMAMLLITDGDIEKINVDCLWAGDSRCYVLDGIGLHQLSMDDVECKDAMTNLSEDGVLKNVINASTAYEIHFRQYSFSRPCLLFSATDGCFGYLPSPMHFEYFLLKTLISSSSLQEWKMRIDQSLQSCAGDDYTICAVGYGFKSFDELKSHYSFRYNELTQNYISNDRDLQELWQNYKPAYEMYL